MNIYSGFKFACLPATSGWKKSCFHGGLEVLWMARWFFFFFFNDTATTEIYTLSLHDALPIRSLRPRASRVPSAERRTARRTHRSEEHTSELQSRQYLVCRLLLEKKNNQKMREDPVQLKTEELNQITYPLAG